ncbi:hypothetical protein LTS09_018198, partial [Friedmanniomyces endolithicus]
MSEDVVRLMDKMNLGQSIHKRKAIEKGTHHEVALNDGTNKLLHLTQETAAQADLVQSLNASLQAGDDMVSAEQDKPYVLLPATSFSPTHSPLLTEETAQRFRERHLAQAVMLRDVKPCTDLLILSPWPISSPFESLPLRRRAAQSFRDSDQESPHNDRIKPAK